MDFFYKNLKNVKEWSIKAIKLLISCSVSLGNPLFEKIPDIIKSAKEDFRESLIKHLTLAVLMEFDFKVSTWF